MKMVAHELILVDQVVRVSLEAKSVMRDSGLDSGCTLLLTLVKMIALVMWKTQKNPTTSQEICF